MCVVSLGGLAGCGADDDEDSSREQVLAAAARTLATGSAFIETEIDTKGEDARFLQRVDFETERAAGTLIVSGGTEQVEDPIRQYIDGPRSFIRDPDSGDRYEQEKGAIAQLRDSPTSLLALLDETLVDVVESSRTAPAGLQRFDGGYEVAAIAEVAGEEVPEELVGVDFPISLYVDEEGLVPRIDLTIGDLRSVIQLSRFGEDPRIGEPPEPVGTVPAESGL
jgi:hypothetical protein